MVTGTRNLLQNRALSSDHKPREAHESPRILNQNTNRVSVATDVALGLTVSRLSVFMGSLAVSPFQTAYDKEISQ